MSSQPIFGVNWTLSHPFLQKTNKQYLFACYFPSMNEKEHQISNGTHIDYLKHRHMLGLMLMYACLAVDM